MNKRRWKLVIFAAIILIGAFTWQSRDKNEQEAISRILDHTAEIDAIELFKGEQTLFSATGQDAKAYIENYPLSHVKKLSKKNELYLKKSHFIILSTKLKESLYMR